MIKIFIVLNEGTLKTVKYFLLKNCVSMLIAVEIVHFV